MPTVAELAASEARDIGFVLFISGVPWAVTNRPELVGKGPDSWIGTAYGAGRRVVEGLELQKNQIVTDAVSTESGMPSSSDGCTFKINDLDGLLIEYMRTAEGDAVGQLLRPRDDPAPATLIGDTGDSVPIWGRWVNKEAIGSDGSRNRYQCFPGDPMPGFNHAAFSGDMQNLAPSLVYDAPRHEVGRMVVLYRLHRDMSSSAEDHTAWANWEDQIAGGYALAFVGTVKELTADGKMYSLVCDGPSSLLRRMLNTTRPSEWARVSTTVNLDTTDGQREDLFAIDCWLEKSGTPQIKQGGRSYFTVADELPAGATPFFIRAALSARLADVIATAGDGPEALVWTNHDDAAFDNYGVFKGAATIGSGFLRVELTHTQPVDNAKTYWAAVFRIIAHEKVWKVLGWDPVLQGTLYAFEDAYSVRFLSTEVLAKRGISVPAPNYWAADITTVPIGFASATEAGTAAENNENPRSFLAKFAEGMDLLDPLAKQEITVGIGPATPYCEPQTNLAVAQHTFTNDGGEADSTGYIALKARYRTEDEDAEITTQVAIAKVGWREDDQYGGSTFGQDSNGNSQLYIESYMDPRYFGCDRPRFTKVWGASDLEWVSVAWLGWNTDYGDRADMVLGRLLLSTGTSYITGYLGENPVRTLGANAHPDATIEVGNDVEISDISLGLPAQLLDWRSLTKTVALLPGGGASSPLARCKHAFIGPFDSQNLVARILAPRGWALAFNRGRFRLFSLAQTLTPELATVLIEPDDFIGDGVFVESVNLQPLTAKDSMSVSYGEPLVSEAAAEDMDLSLMTRSQDPGARTRQGNASMDIDGQGLIPVKLWRDENPPPSWYSAWLELFGKTMGTWYAAPHVKVSGVKLQWSKARLLGPGSVVVFSSLFAPSRDGVYGLQSKLARVLSVAHNLYEGNSTVEFLCQPGSLTATRRFGPCAWALDLVSTVEQRHDAGARTIYCHQNFFAHEGDNVDVAGFIEPEYLGIGGEAVVWGYQWNGSGEDEDWPQTFSFTLESVSIAGNSLTYKPGSFSGVFNEAAPTCMVLAPMDSQPPDSWVRSYFTPHTGPDGFFGATKGYPLL